ncbi:MAG: hypothetical protein IPK82_40015 [Polyangiaceae bacterium]|nr:hypothetical protein [Polyangiaceae bacterium]
MLALERFAELRAAIERSGDRDRVLRDAGIAVRDWMQAQRHWLAQMAAEASQGRRDLSERYRRAFEGIELVQAAQVEASPPPEPQPEVRSEPRSEAPAYVPSYMVGKPSPMAAVAAPAPPSPPAQHVYTPAVAPPGPVAISNAPQVNLPPAALAGTGMALPIPRGPVMPFRDEGKPHDKGAEPSAAAVHTPPADPNRPVVNVAPPSVTGTALDLGISKVVAAIPFKATQPSKTPSTSSAQSVSSSSASAAPPSTQGQESTQPRAAVPEITVEQYAWLVAVLRRARTPGETEQAFRALRLSPDIRKPLEDAWRDRMAKDPTLQQRFIAALSQLPGGGR